MPTRIVELLNEMVENGYFIDRSDAVRAALYHFVMEHYRLQREHKTPRVLAGYR
ncbi:MAG: hypothetical protein QXT64_02250 [Desulfurococcaceae archaeon]